MSNQLKTMRLLLSLLFFLFCSASIYAQEQHVTIKLQNASLTDVFKAIEKQTTYHFSYRDVVVDSKNDITVSRTDAPVSEILNEVMKNKNLTYSIVSSKSIVISEKRNLQSATSEKPKTISGTVKDKNGEPIIGVSLFVKGLNTGTITDMDGKFTLNAPLNSTVNITYVGYIAQSITISDKQTYDIVLIENTESLDEVVVVGYGTSRKRDIVSAMANIKGKEFTKASTSNVKDILQGKVAGVDVESARFPGDDRGILIRGYRSLNAGNNPLIVVDGIPGSFSNINTHDIESMEVLKDAASSAIYGSMGANGVILVTTKRAKKGVKREVNFNSYVGINVPHMMKLQSGEDYTQFRRDGYRYAHGWDKPFTDKDVFMESELDIINNGNYTDWQDMMYRNGVVQSYYLSVANSGERTKLFTSFKYDKENGYYKTNSVENLNLTISADHELASFWTIGSTIRLRRKNVSEFYLSASTRQGSTELLYMTPLSKPYNDDGTLNYFPNPLNTSGYNPLSDYEEGQYANDWQSNAVELNLSSNITFSKNFKMQTNFGFLFNDYKRGFFYGKNAYVNKGVNRSSGKEYNNSDKYTLNNILTYDVNWGDHTLTADLIGEIQKYKEDNTGLSGTNQPVEYTTYHNLQSNTENISINSGYNDHALASGLVRVRYNFLNKYFLNVAIRSDGSSRLAKGNKWDYFPSGGIGWSIRDEEFMKNANFVDNLKLRFSYGTVGNTAISPYQTQATLSQKRYLFGETSGYKINVYYPTRIPNYDLGWEISRTANLGLDFAFLNNKINGYVEVYQTRTSDVLMQRAIPTFSGFTSIWQNIGKTENKGLEISLNYAPVRSKDLSIDFTLNASRNWEKIISLISGEDLPNNALFIGQPIGVHYNYEKLGIWQLGEEAEAAKYNAKPGDLRVRDIDDDGTISAANDRTILGQQRPKWIASFGGNLQYKDLDFSFNLTSRWGHLVNVIPYNDLTMDGQRWLPEVNYWTPENPTNDYPRADAAAGYDPYRYANGYMKGDFIKLQDITIGYSFERLLSKRIPIKKVRLYFQGRNLVYLYKAAKYDIVPEAPNFNLTVPSSYNVGLNVTF